MSIYLSSNQKELLVRFRSSHRRCSVRKGVFRNFAKFTGKHLCQSLFFNKVAGLSLLQKTSGQLLLKLLIQHLVILGIRNKEASNVANIQRYCHIWMKYVLTSIISTSCMIWFFCYFSHEMNNESNPCVELKWLDSSFFKLRTPLWQKPVPKRRYMYAYSCWWALSDTWNFTSNEAGTKYGVSNGCQYLW